MKTSQPVTKFELDLTIKEAFEKYDETNRGYRDQILTGLDEVMNELETIREDSVLGNHQTVERLDNHEKRIAKLESS